MFIAHAVPVSSSPASTPSAATTQGEVLHTLESAAGSQRAYGPVNMLLRLPGTEAVGVRASTSELVLYQTNPVFEKLASSILRDTIEGYRLVYVHEGALPEPPDAGFGKQPWWDRRLHMIKAISNLPGVHDFAFAGTRAVAIHAANEEARAGLRAVLRDTLPDATQTKIHLVVSRNGPEG